MQRSPFVLPLALIAAAVVIGGLGFSLANASSPVLVQILALVLISVAAVALLFAAGGLASAVVLAVRDRKNESSRDK
ncbi:MAG: hypothetical protein Kow00129_06260 [Thermoleophilia bacterium]